MEIDPFRPGKEIGDTLEAIAAKCIKEDAGFVFIRFGGPFRARYHAELESRIRSNFAGARIPCVALYAEGAEDLGDRNKEEFDTRKPKLLYTGLIDPFAHFQAWKAENDARKKGRGASRSQILQAIAVLRSSGFTFEQVADRLNSQNLSSTIGRLWSAESLRKFVKRNGRYDAAQQ